MEGCTPGQCATRRLHLGAVILAAGAGSRLGFRPKGLISVSGEPLLRRHLRLLSAVGVDELVVVLGHHAEQLVPLLEDYCDATLVIQPVDDHSQSASLTLGLSALSASIDAALVVPVDMPALETPDLIALIGAFKHAETGIEFVGPVVNGQPGNPVLLSRSIVDQVLRGEGDATRNAILGESYGQDPDFFEFFRSLEAYKETFAREGTTMVLSPNSDFFKYFGNLEGGRDRVIDRQQSQ